MQHAIDYFCLVYELSLGDLAKLLGVKQPQINSWKKGLRNIPEKHLITLCDIFNVPEERKYLFERSSLSEMDHSEIEIYLNKAKLKYYEGCDDEVIDKSVRLHFEQNIILNERNIEILTITNTLKQELFRYSHIPDKFYQRMDKVEKLIQELKEG